MDIYWKQWFILDWLQYKYVYVAFLLYNKYTSLFIYYMGERITLFLLNFQNQFEQKTTSFLIDGTLFDILFGNVTSGRRPEVEFLNGIFSGGF
jgi:hypothetical protein